ncbi:hypothetical protein P5P86_02705 [Nocardioides sp. BP30]|uniref:hypothetical protein n=1 Tax=Nocardioides sp. BP30 TaxID=3036374 RepID=UPI0024684A79|nr:hypothetical protein [Nocardioides sp. BP30]WGL52743.1 hypothetical protein P5P86_02705 [Nocardioides sp. BP30]
MSAPQAHITGVSGGEVLAAAYDDLDRLAGTYAHTGVRLLGWSSLPTETLVDPDLLASAAFAPLSFGRVEVALAALLAGHESLPVVAAEWEALAAAVVGARLSIEAADIGEGRRLWVDAKEALFLDGSGLSPLDRGELALAGAGALLTTRLGEGGIALGSRALAALYGEESPPVTVRVPLSVPASDRAPRDIVDLVEHLGELSGTDPALDGVVEVQTLVADDGARRHVVYLPGTDDMDPLSSDDQVRDMHENLRLLAGQSTAYGAGVLAAMHAAGIRPGEQVLLVGHSQGGMEAVALASHASPYRVSDVVTLGAPTAQVHHYPPGVHVLSLEHEGDLVPQLAGQGSASAQHVTVRFDSGVQGVVANHSLEHYTAGAAAVDASADPDVVAARDELSGFLRAGGQAHGQVFAITRDR